MKNSSGIEKPGFDCKQCGHCCEGRGGIIVALRDRERLSAYCGLSEKAFVSRFCEARGEASGKLALRSGSDGFCVFFVAGKGCVVHPAKPDICRAWPYFRGNLVDAESLEMAKGFCPGIPEEQSHESFVREGLACLVREGLAGITGDDAAAALGVADLFASGRAPANR